MSKLIFEKCKNCGAQLDANKALNGVLECDYCGSTFTLPKEETDSGALEQLKIASNELDLCRFEGAFESYKKAAALDENEPEAYFGTVLAEFKVQYLKDNLKHRLQPICHTVTEKKFSDNKSYLRALSLATNEQREEYIRRATEIDYIANEFYRLKAQGVKYDCFLCVKVTDDETGMRTADYKYADDIYFSLRGKGYKPFFSERELKNVTGADYEARILYALWCSECMLVVCGKEEYLNTPWVKNEYTRYLALIRDEEKESDSITLAFHGKPIEKLPGKNGKIQGINLNAIDAAERVTAFVESHTPEAKKRREAEEKKKRAAEEELRKTVEEQKKAQREIEERLKNIQRGAAVAAAPAGVGSNVEKLLVRAKQELDFGDFATAAKYYAQAIDSDPENGEGWFGAFLCENKVKNEEELLNGITLDKINAIRKNKNYLFAQKNASGEFKERVKLFTQKLTQTEEAFEQAEKHRKQEMEHHAWAKVNDPSIDNYETSEFLIQDKTLVKYKGNKAEVKIPRGITVICANAFDGCKTLTKIIFPDSLKNIRSFAFLGCSGLTNFTIPNSVTSIGVSSFSGCSGLTSITIPNSVTEIGNSAFSGCIGLTDITIPNSVTNIGDSTFYGCSSLTDITIPNSVTSIGGSAFRGCFSLTSIKIPDSITNIGSDAFRGCDGLTGVYITDIAAWCKIAFGNSYSNPLYDVHNLYLDEKLVTELIIPNSVTSIGSFVFWDCSKLTNITIPNSVASIGSFVFRGCSGLTSITIPNGVTSVGKGAFRNCNSLTKIAISDSVTSIGYQAFYGCSGLASIIIPDSVTNIGDQAFYDCSELISVTIPKRFKKQRKKIFASCKKIKFTFTK